VVLIERIYLILSNIILGILEVVYKRREKKKIEKKRKEFISWKEEPEMLSGGGSVTLILKADSESMVADANRANNELSWVLSNVPVKKVDELVLGDMGGYNDQLCERDTMKKELYFTGKSVRFLFVLILLLFFSSFCSAYSFEVGFTSKFTTDQYTCYGGDFVPNTGTAELFVKSGYSCSEGGDLFKEVPCKNVGENLLVTIPPGGDAVVRCVLDSSPFEEGLNCVKVRWCGAENEFVYKEEPASAVQDKDSPDKGSLGVFVDLKDEGDGKISANLRNKYIPEGSIEEKNCESCTLDWGDGVKVDASSGLVKAIH
jgi:hypothetical protein